MSRNLQNRIVSEIDPIYVYKDWRQKKLRIAVYTRVSTDSSDQESSLRNQKDHYDQAVHTNPLWEYIDLYVDDGISGTSIHNRSAFNRMIEDCKAGKIDLIVVKEVSRFARNLVDCMKTVELLQSLNPPVGVFFENNNINTLDSCNKLLLTFYALFAEFDSEMKSQSVKWGNNVCFERGDYFCPSRLLGYEKVGKYELRIEPEGAKTVRLIYDLFLAGYSTKEIANVMVSLSRPTGMGNLKWLSSSVTGILKNEKYCGDFVMQKTFVADFKSHKPIRNKGQRKLFYESKHHEGIVSKAEHFRVLLLLKSNQTSPYYDPLFVIKIIRQGLLSGFIPMNPVFGGYDASNYLSAFETARIPFPEIETEVSHIVGARRIRRELFNDRNTAAVTFSKQGLHINPGCIFLMKDTTHVEILLHPAERLLAVRKTLPQNRNAISWKALFIHFRELMHIIYQLMRWKKDWKYKATAHCFSKNNENVLFFDLGSCEFRFRKDNQLIKAIPSEWISEFGESFQEHVMLRRCALARKLDNWMLSAPPSPVEGFELDIEPLTRDQADKRITKMRNEHEK